MIKRLRRMMWCGICSYMDNKDIHLEECLGTRPLVSEEVSAGCGDLGVQFNARMFVSIRLSRYQDPIKIEKWNGTTLNAQSAFL